MAYARSIDHQSRATDEVWVLLQGWFASFYRFKDSVTVGELMRANKDRITSASSLLAALYLLEQEKKVRLEKSTGHIDYRDSIRIFALGCQ